MSGVKLHAIEHIDRTLSRTNSTNSDVRHVT
jgi:hypothetical protein